MWDWGTTAPTQKLEVAGKVQGQRSGQRNHVWNVQITTPGKGIVVQSPDEPNADRLGWIIQEVAS